MKRLALLLSVGLLAGCGGAGTPKTATTTPATPGPAAAMAGLIRSDPALAGTVKVLFVSSGWSLVQSISPTSAVAIPFHLVGGRWRADRVKGVEISILGPNPGQHVAPIPQVAMEITARAPFVESALWVDGVMLEAKGGGSPTNGTIYGAPTRALAKGSHVAVGYARTATRAGAVAWRFVVS